MATYRDYCDAFDDEYTPDPTRAPVAELRREERRKATAALADAARKLDLTAMETALDAGGAADACIPPAAALVVGASVRRRLHATGTIEDEVAELAKLHLAALTLLADYGGLSREGATDALMRAARSASGHAAVVRYLLEKGRANIHCIDINDWSTVLHRVGRPDVAQVLLDAGADVHARDGAGNTPLATVIVGDAWNAWRTAPVLLDAGADPTVRGSGLPAPVDAVKAGLDAMVEEGAHAWPLQQQVQLVKTVTRAAVWHRRRHMLLAIRWRCRITRPAPTTAPVSAASDDEIF